jgi:SAM-dependent methyltransferase
MSQQGRSASDAAIAAVQALVDEALRHRAGPTVLEAGCGSTTRLRLPGDARLVGIDISRAQIERHQRLYRSLVGDIQTYAFDEEQFDLIVCWNVLEHVSRPQDAVANLARSLGTGGLLVVAGPVLWSVKGLVTRFTPFFVHRWFYRWMGDHRPASELDQFPTFLRRATAPHALCAQASLLGLERRLCHLYEGPVQEDFRRRSGVADAMFGLAERLSRLSGTGRNGYALERSDAVLVFQRRADPAVAALPVTRQEVTHA